jgi:CDP-glycerol glycerophosphotransferase (TagB/SpsB family)
VFTSAAALYRSLAITCQAVAELPGVRLVVKLHPHGEGREAAYEAALAAWGGPDVVVCRNEDLLDLIGMSSCVVVLTSSVGFEAASLRKPLVVADTYRASDVVPYCSEGVAVSAASTSEMATALAAAIRGATVADETYDRFNEKYSGPAEGDASVRLADVIQECAEQYGAQNR